MGFSKAFYFFYYAAMASFLPFVILYYEQIGLSGREIGLLAGIPPLLMLVSAPLWGGLADATQQHKRLLMLAIGGSLIAVLALSFTTMDTPLSWLIPIVVGYAFFVAPIMPLGDKTVLELLGDRRNQYGKQRLWGAVGWGIAAPIVGLMIQRADLHWAFYSYLLLMILCGLVIAFWMPVSHASITPRYWSSLRMLITDWQWLLFLATVVIIGISAAINTNFLFLFLNDLGASKTLMGISLTFATASELPVMFFADRLLSRWGARGLLIFSLLVYIIRLFAYSFMRAPWLVLPLQLLHGPSFAAMWVAGVSYADQLAPEGMGTTAQGLFSGVHMGLGAALGALIGGFLYEGLGPVPMFRWAGTGALLGLLFFALAGSRAARNMKPVLHK